MLEDLYTDAFLQDMARNIAGDDELLTREVTQRLNILVGTSPFDDADDEDYTYYGLPAAAVSPTTLEDD